MHKQIISGKFDLNINGMDLVYIPLENNLSDDEVESATTSSTIVSDEIGIVKLCLIGEEITKTFSTPKKRQNYGRMAPVSRHIQTDF